MKYRKSLLCVVENEKRIKPGAALKAAARSRLESENAALARRGAKRQLQRLRRKRAAAVNKETQNLRIIRLSAFSRNGVAQRAGSVALSHYMHRRKLQTRSAAAASARLASRNEMK